MTPKAVVKMQEIERKLVNGAKRSWPEWIRLIVYVSAIAITGIFVFEKRADGIQTQVNGNAASVAANARAIQRLLPPLEELAQLATDVEVINRTRWTSTNAAEESKEIWEAIFKTKLDIAALPPDSFEKKFDDLADEMRSELRNIQNRLTRIESRIGESPK
jgi:hypothetical protein